MENWRVKLFASSNAHIIGVLCKIRHYFQRFMQKFQAMQCCYSKFSHGITHWTLYTNLYINRPACCITYTNKHKNLNTPCKNTKYKNLMNWNTMSVKSLCSNFATMTLFCAVHWLVYAGYWTLGTCSQKAQPQN